MTVQTTESPRHDAPTWADDEIDLRKYLLVLIAWWREIVLVTILVAVVAVGIVILLQNIGTPEYEASSNVIVAVVTSQIRLDERVQTTVDTQTTPNNDRRSSLLALINDGAIAQAVIDELGDALPSRLREPAALAKRISGQVPTDGQSSVITISATTSDPALSALIANVWTTKYVTYINQLYGEVPASTLETVQAELEKARATYAASQTEYETFIANNRLDELNRLINEKTALRDSLVHSRTLAITTIINAQSEAQTQAYAYLVKRPVNVAISELSAEELVVVEQVSDLRRRQVTTQIQLERARNLERQLEEGGDAAARTTMVSLQLLKEQIFASPVFEPVNETSNVTSLLTVETPNTTISAEDQLTDVRSLISVLESYSEELARQVAEADAWQLLQGSSAEVTEALETTEVDAAGSASLDAYETTLNNMLSGLLGPNGMYTQLAEMQVGDPAAQQFVMELEAELQDLRAALAAETSRERQLIQERDLTWNTYDALNNKLVELTLMRTSANSILRLAGPALEPLAPTPTIAPILPVAAATIAGLIGMILLAFLANSLGAQPFLSRRQAQQS